MCIESLETRQHFAVVDQVADIFDFAQLAGHFNSSGNWVSGGSVAEPGIGAFLDLASHFPSLGQVSERNADLNGDSRVDLADFEHFCETAISSAGNNFIRNSAGPGDSDGNGRIDKFDIRAMSASFNEYGNWQNGDFTMNRRVNIQDFALAAANVLAD